MSLPHSHILLPLCSKPSCSRSSSAHNSSIPNILHSPLSLKSSSFLFCSCRHNRLTRVNHQRILWTENDRNSPFRFSARAALGSDEKNNEGGEEGEGGGEEVSSSEEFRSRMERMVGSADEAFRGRDLASLIRNKYGKSYDVQLIKKEFMGRQLLAMNVMWKYREQKSFPLTEEEYIYHLDSVADNLRCWGAVSTVRTSLEKTKERPRIGKAVSIFIDIDDTGGRANEWINR